MSSDWSTVNAQSTSTTTSHHSTPTKPRLVSHRFTHQSVDEGLKEELNRYRHSGISFEDFLKSAFAVSTTEMEDLKKTVKETSVHTTDAYQREQATFAEFAKDSEVGMYKPFAIMSNMVLGPHRSGERIKVLDFDGNTYVTSGFASRKPDVVLVPKKDGETDLSMSTVKWHHMLCVLEFKKKQKQKESATKSTTIGKRTREGQEMETVGGDRKRPSSSSTKSGMSGSHVSTHTGANSPRAPLQVTMESERRQGPTTEDWSVISNEDVEGHTSVSSSIGGRRSLRRGKPKGKGTSSNHGNSNVPLDGIDTPETSTARELMGPPDVFMQGALQPETVQSEGHASGTNEDYSVLRRTSAIISNPTQATGISSNATARSQTGGGTANDVEVQLANYVTEVMSDRSDRTFAFGATVEHTKMRLTYYSRSTYVISDEIDILNQPELFALFLVLFSMQSLEKLGFNTDIKFCDPFDTKREESKPLAVQLEAIEGGDNFGLKPNADLKLGKCIHKEYCLLGRATTVYDLERSGGCDIDLVLKLSWQKKSKRREDKAILIARDVDAKHSPEIYGVAVLNEKSPSAGFKKACRTAPNTEERELRILLMRKYHNVEDLEDAEFIAIIPQFVIYVHKLFSEKELLHRDISIFNMAYYEKDNEKIAVLIDFDLATFPEDSESSTEVPAEPLATATQDNLQGAVAVPNAVQPVLQERSGTTPFMAIETLDSDSPGYKHHLCHELESIFYVIIWHAVGYRHKKGIYPTKDNRNNTDRRKVDILKGWRAGSWEQVKTQKKTFFNEVWIILDHVIDVRIRATAYKLQDIFRLGLRSAIDRTIYERTLALEATIMQNHAINPEPTPNVSIPSVTIFPAFAAKLGIVGMECEKSCCVA